MHSRFVEQILNAAARENDSIRRTPRRPSYETFA